MISVAQCEQLYFVFLNKGLNRTKLDKATGAKMQAGHLGNFGRLARLDKLFFAGPLGDDGYIRGTVVVLASSLADVIEMFGPDPLVANGRLAIEAYPWNADRSVFKKAGETLKLEQIALVIVKRGSKSADYGAIKSIGEWTQSGDLAATGPVVGDSKIVGIMLFRVYDLKKVKLLLSKDEAFRSGALVADVRPQYTDAAVIARD